MSDQPINDGGPAFPLPDAEPGFACSHEGMSLRDWFAGQAEIGAADIETLTRRMFQAELLDATLEQQIEAEARLRYMKADAMLAQRQKGGGR